MFDFWSIFNLIMTLLIIGLLFLFCYVYYHSLKDMSYWIVKIDSDSFRFFDYLTEKGEQEEYFWQRIEYPQKTGWNGHTYSPFTHLMKIGDKIAIWVTGIKTGFYAIGEIEEVPVKHHEPDPEKLHYYKVKVEPNPIPTVKIRLMATFFDKPITKEQCDSDPILSSVINTKKDDFPIYWMNSVHWTRIISLLQALGVEIKKSMNELNTLGKYS